MADGFQPRNSPWAAVVQLEQVAQAVMAGSRWMGCFLLPTDLLVSNEDI